LEARLVANELHNSPSLQELYAQYDEKVQLEAKIKTIKKEIKQVNFFFKKKKKNIFFL